MISESCGNPNDFIVSEGQVHNSKISNQLIEISNAEVLIADRAYHDQKIKKSCKKKLLWL